jgi:hypothetical protein
MASRIDEHAEMSAHTVIHATVVRMQHVADRTGKSIGMIYDLSADRIRFVEMGSGGFDRTTVFRVVTPRPGLRQVQDGAFAALLAGAA